MVFVFFSCMVADGSLGNFSFGGPDVESCFDTLNDRVKSGWQLVSAILIESPAKAINLPVEAFDGWPIREELEKLQATWEMLLVNPYSNSLTVTVRVVRAQNAADSIRRAMLKQDRASQQRERRQRHVANLFTKMDAILARIQETKVEWGVV